MHGRGDSDEAGMFPSGRMQDAEARRALERYLNTGARGLWHDRRLPDGSFVREPSPASGFYHIVCAIGGLASALETAVA